MIQREARSHSPWPTCITLVWLVADKVRFSVFPYFPIPHISPLVSVPMLRCSQHDACGQVVCSLRRSGRPLGLCATDDGLCGSFVSRRSAAGCEPLRTVPLLQSEDPASLQTPPRLPPPPDEEVLRPCTAQPRLQDSGGMHWPPTWAWNIHQNRIH